MNAPKNILYILLLFYSICNAQETGSKMLYPYDYDTEKDSYSVRGGKNYVNIGLVTSSIKPGNRSTIRNYNGTAFTIGRTFFLTGYDYTSVVRFGIDATWFDLNYTDYRIRHITEMGQNTYKTNQVDFALQAGPSVLINPIGKLCISCYSRLAPSYSLLQSNNKYQTRYVTFIVNGVSLSYGWIGLGIENRYGPNSNTLYPNSTDGDLSLISSEYVGWKSFILFRF